jgi:thioredoxin-like negative regulator of GroEL
MMQSQAQSLSEFPDQLIAADPAFITALRTQLTLPEIMHTQWLADALAHRIARSPKDLRSHVQRIMLHQQQGESDALFAALLDLFISLGSLGLALRKRLLQTSVSLLNTRQSEFLTARLESGVSTNETHPSAPRSRLSQGGTGSSDFISRNASSINLDLRSPIEQALDFLNYGQLDLAQQTLEQALIENPDDKAISHELADLYSHTHDTVAIANLITKLGIHTPDTIRNVANKLIAGAE